MYTCIYYRMCQPKTIAVSGHPVQRVGKIGMKALDASRRAGVTWAVRTSQWTPQTCTREVPTMVPRCRYWCPQIRRLWVRFASICREPTHQTHCIGGVRSSDARSKTGTTCDVTRYEKRASGGSPKPFCEVSPAGFEPATSGSGARARMRATLDERKELGRQRRGQVLSVVLFCSPRMAAFRRKHVLGQRSAHYRPSPGWSPCPASATVRSRLCALPADRISPFLQAGVAGSQKDVISSVHNHLRIIARCPS